MLYTDIYICLNIDNIYIHRGSAVLSRRRRGQSVVPPEEKRKRNFAAAHPSSTASSARSVSHPPVRCLRSKSESATNCSQFATNRQLDCASWHPPQGRPCTKWKQVPYRKELVPRDRRHRTYAAGGRRGVTLSGGGGGMIRVALVAWPKHTRAARWNRAPSVRLCALE
jgi:hypothetical protein